MTFTELLGLRIPIVQAPMAGISTVKLAAQVTKFGGLGSIPFGSFDLSKSVEPVRKQLQEFTALTKSSCVNLNFFCHPIAHQPIATQKQIDNWHGLFSSVTKTDSHKYVAELLNGNVSFKVLEDHPQQLLSFLDILKEYKPRVVSFHFGLPEQATIHKLQELNILVFVCVTSVDEAKVAIENGVDGLFVQGFEAGGHRGNFLVDQEHDKNESTKALFEAIGAYLASIDSDKPYLVPAGGIVNGKIAKQFIKDGALAVSMGTVFVPTPESNSNDFVKNQIESNDEPLPTVMTRLVSGKPARCLRTPFIDRLVETHQQFPDLPAYGYSYYGYKTLNLALKNKDYGFYLVGSNYHQIDPGLTTVQVLEKITKELE